MPELTGGASADRSGIGRAVQVRLLPAEPDLDSRPGACARTNSTACGTADRPPLYLRAARHFRAHPAIGYLTAIASVGVATMLQWLGRDLYEGAPFLTIYPAVALTGLVGGYRPALLCAFLAGLSQWYLFIPQHTWVAVVTYAFDVVL